jgi:hypothetical protein
VVRQPDLPVIAVAGTYDDTVVRTSERWEFQSRQLSHDIAGVDSM